MKEQGIDSLANLFGENARVHFDTYIEPTVADVMDAVLLWKVEYALLLLLLALMAVIIHRSDGVIGRVIQMTSSFPVMMRQLNYVNQTVEIVSGRIAALFFLVLPLVGFSYYRTINPNLFFDGDFTIIYRLFFLSIIIWVYVKIMKVIFLNFSKRNNFYRKLYLAHKICSSTYIVILFPLLLLTLVSSPYRDVLNWVQLLLMGLFCAHYLITELKLFIEEKVSYVQLILYFCTVNVVLLGFIIYFVLYFV